MSRELILAGFIMATGLCVAGVGTHLYQGIFRQDALLRYDGKTYLHRVGHLLMSFICGPYIMLQMGWRQESDDAIAVGPVLISSLVAFGWSFVTGLLALGCYGFMTR